MAGYRGERVILEQAPIVGDFKVRLVVQRPGPDVVLSVCLTPVNGPTSLKEKELIFSLAIHHGRARFDRHIRLPVQYQNQGLGTWVLSTLVHEAIALGYGELRVQGLHLIAQDKSPLRDAFYRSMGFAVDVDRNGSGWARVKRLADLRSDPNPLKVRSQPFPLV